jgi:sulfatase modifying factor 1
MDTATATPPGEAPAEQMCWIPGGTFRMGSDRFYPEERPVTEVAVDGFWMDEHPVTVAEYARFVEDTGHVTFAERPPNPAD